MQYKKCPHCGESKPYTAFSVGSTTALASWCRECTRARAEETLARNRKKWSNEDPREVTQQKICKDCKQLLDSSQFGIRRNASDGLHCRCKQCQSIRRRRKTLKNTLKHFSMSDHDFQAAWAAQNGLCALCGTSLHRRSSRGCHIDHCHVTGRFRGLLCGGCNTALGKLGDTPDALQRALDYVTTGCYTTPRSER